MKKLIFAIALMAITGMAFAQKNLVESKSLVGIWQQAIVGQSITGKASIQKMRNYKVLNADNTIYTLFDKGGNLVIGLYGSYEMTSDSTFTEKIIKHGQNPSMNGTESQLRFKMIDENTIALEYFNSTSNRWIKEVWVRVPLVGSEGLMR